MLELLGSLKYGYDHQVYKYFALIILTEGTAVELESLDTWDALLN